MRKNKTKLFRPAFTVLVMVVFTACNSPYTPKPKTYPSIHFPEQTYQRYVSDICPMSFDVPVYGTVERDSLYFDRELQDDCWLNVRIPRFKATLHLSYKQLEQRYDLDQLVEEAFKLTYRHVERADFIQPKMLQTDDEVIGIWYDLGGNSASNAQFYVTDTAQHFIRAALYLRERPNIDSLAPIVEFVKSDFEHLVRSIEWED